MKIIEKIFDVTTGEETIVEREETQEEKTARLEYQAKLVAQEEEELAKATAKADLLEKLGITEEEAKLLLS
jgi:hypothetical protein